MGRTGNQGRARRIGQRALHVFGEYQASRRKHATRCHRPQQAKRQAIHVLVRHAGVHAATADAITERGIERADFRAQLRQAFADQHRLAGRSGREHVQGIALLIQCQPRRIRDHGERTYLRQIRRRRHVAGDRAHLGRQSPQRARQQVWRQHRLLAGMPGAEQRRGKIETVFEMEGDASAGHLRKDRAPTRSQCREFGERHRRTVPQGNDRIGRTPMRHPAVEIDELSHARCSRVRAGAPATRPRTASPSARRR